jgi:hypothetical protein
MINLLRILRGSPGVFAAATIALLVLAGCKNPAGGDNGAFTAVTGIRGVPVFGIKGVELDLRGAAVEPAGAAHTTITWSFFDGPGTGVEPGDLDTGVCIPTGAGTLWVMGTVKEGAAPGRDYTGLFRIVISANGVFKKSSASEEWQAVADFVETDLAAALAWIAENAADHEEYLVQLGEDQEIPGINFPGGREDLKVTLRGYGGERNVTWNGDSDSFFAPGLPSIPGLFTVYTGTTLILDSGVTLDGEDTFMSKSPNYSVSGLPMIVLEGGALVMKEGSKITRVSMGSFSWGAVHSAELTNTDQQNGITSKTSRFVMEGGEITDCSVYASALNLQNCIARMSGGRITGNRFTSVVRHPHDPGAMVRLSRNTEFVMEGGCITANDGQGVMIDAYEKTAAFTMTGGEITCNGTELIAAGLDAGKPMMGAGIFLNYGTVTLRGGTISGNGNAGFPGGGVIIRDTFIIDGTVAIEDSLSVTGGANGSSPISSPIYLGPGFSSSAGPIAIDLVSWNETAWNVSWGGPTVPLSVLASREPDGLPISREVADGFSLGKGLVVALERGGHYSVTEKDISGLSLGEDGFVYRNE